MSGLDGAGHALILVGLVLALLGGAVTLAGRIPALSALGRLPGDIVLRWGNGVVFVPLAASLLLSVGLTLLLNLIVTLLR